MDILTLVDRLEGLVNAGWRVPFSNKTLIDEAALFEIIDQMRVSIPEQIREAEEVLQSKETIEAATQVEAENLIQQARQQITRLVDEHEIAAAARVQADNIKAQALRSADEVRKGAEDYAVGVLSDLESRLSTLLRTTSNGLAKLQRKSVPRSPEDAAGAQQQKRS